MSRKIKGVEKYDLVTECAICERNLNTDPYKITLDDNSEMHVCETCGKSMILLFDFPENKVVERN